MSKQVLKDFMVDRARKILDDKLEIAGGLVGVDMADVVELAEEVLQFFKPAPAQFRCSVCKGTNVQHAMWVDVNTDEVDAAGVFGSWNEGDIEEIPEQS